MRMAKSFLRPNKRTHYRNQSFRRLVLEPLEFAALVIG